MGESEKALLKEGDRENIWTVPVFDVYSVPFS
jgi:hypothetical protein